MIGPAVVQDVRKKSSRTKKRVFIVSALIFKPGIHIKRRIIYFDKFRYTILTVITKHKTLLRYGLIIT